MLASVVSDDVCQILHDQKASDPDKTRAALAALPDSWSFNATSSRPDSTRTAPNAAPPLEHKDIADRRRPPVHVSSRGPPHERSGSGIVFSSDVGGPGA